MGAKRLSFVALFLLAGCGRDGTMGSCSAHKIRSYVPVEWELPYSHLCPSAKLNLSCPGPIPDRALCPRLLFDGLFWTLNERQVFFLSELFAPDFIFVDEIAQISYEGRTREIESITRAFDPFWDVKFDLELEDWVFTDYGCLMMKGLVKMTLRSLDGLGVEIRDRSILTSCRQPEDYIWRLTEWRILESVSTDDLTDGFELATWGEMKERSDDL